MAEPQLHVIEHPLVAHLLGEARDRRTPGSRFREALEWIGLILALHATEDLATTPRRVQTPMQEARVARLAAGITIVPILRAGTGMTGAMLRLIPDAAMGHLGMFRDEDALKPVHYYEKLPATAADGPVLLVDPMLATGGSAVAAASLLKKRGCTDVRFICLIAAPEGVDAMTRAHGNIPIFTAAVDERLDDRGFIIPGLGDAGDRIFGTTAG